MDVSREGGASASQVERTPGRATLTSWVVRPLHSYTQEGWVDNNNHMVESYSSTGLVMVLYVASMVSLCFPHFAQVRTLSMLIVLRALVSANSMCLL